MIPRVVCVACFAVCSLQVIRTEIPLMFADSVDVRAMGAWRDLYRNPTSSCLLWSVRRRAAKLGTEDKTLSGTAVWRTKLCLELRYGGQKQWNKQTLGYLIFSTAVQRSQFRDFALCRTHTAVSRSDQICLHAKWFHVSSKMFVPCEKCMISWDDSTENAVQTAGTVSYGSV